MHRTKVLIGLTLLTALGLAVAQEKDTKTATGTVKAVAGDSITVTGDNNQEWTFAVDSDTTVVAKGASHKMRAAKEAGKSTMITDFVKEKQRVSVKYHEMPGGKLHAAEVTVK
jgi:hypothetical protein